MQIHSSNFHQYDVISPKRSDQLIVTCFNGLLTTVGRRAFPVSAANLWNSLTGHLTSAPKRFPGSVLKLSFSGAPTLT